MHDLLRTRCPISPSSEWWEALVSSCVIWPCNRVFLIVMNWDWEGDVTLSDYLRSFALPGKKKDPADSSQSRLQDSLIKVITVQSKRTWRRHVSHPDISPWSYTGPLWRWWSSQIPWQLWITRHQSKCPEKHRGHGRGADQTACIRIRYVLSLLSFNLGSWGFRRNPQGC